MQVTSRNSSTVGLETNNLLCPTTQKWAKSKSLLTKRLAWCHLKCLSSMRAMDTETSPAILQIHSPSSHQYLSWTWSVMNRCSTPMLTWRAVLLLCKNDQIFQLKLKSTKAVQCMKVSVTSTLLRVSLKWQNLQTCVTNFLTSPLIVSRYAPPKKKEMKWSKLKGRWKNTEISKNNKCSLDAENESWKEHGAMVFLALTMPTHTRPKIFMRKLETIQLKSRTLKTKLTAIEPK